MTNDANAPPTDVERMDMAEQLRGVALGESGRSTAGRWLLRAVEGYRAALLLGDRPTDPVLVSVSKALGEADQAAAMFGALRPERLGDRRLLVFARRMAHARFGEVSG